MKIVSIIGARPQFIKSATISRLFKQEANIEEIIIHTGQHYDSNMSQIFFDELSIPRPHYNLGVGSGTHGKQTALMLDRIEEVLIDVKPDCVLVYGDTNSTVAASLASAKLHIKVAHVEAGLRSFNNQMPEEINRIVTDHVSHVLYAPTTNAIALLKKEGLAKKAVLSGDVMYDALLYNMKLAENKYKISNITNLENYYLATIHRPSNTDNPINLQHIFDAFSKLDLPVLLPLHPRTQKLLKNTKIGLNTHIIEPVGPLQMMLLIKNCKKVFTDSGGLQKEAYLLKKPCITLRAETEWIETLENNWNYVVGTDIKLILEKASNDIFGEQKEFFGNGQAANKIVDHLKNI